MRKLDVQDLLEYSRAAVAVLRTLQIKDETMSYGDFARAIGILEGPNDAWEAWHRQQIDAVLNAVSAIELKAHKKPMALDYSRIVNKRTGKAGKGVKKSSRIVRK